jgi:cyclopropane fatty-acyl-phospholipid synthase-like methyltransferase
MHSMTRAARYDASVAEKVWKGEGSRIDWTQYEGLSYEAFRRRALDPSLSASEKIGFPDALREGAEDRILDSIATLVELSRRSGLLVVDIGCGCGVLTRRMIELCAAHGHELVLVDSAEMLSQLPDSASVRTMPGRFPDPALQMDEYLGRADAVIVYSVLQIVFVEASVFEFVDAALELLAPGGALLIGDVPNISKRKRFFASDRGAAFHRAFMGTAENPDVDFNVIERGKIDDSVILGLLARARVQGFDAYLLPQPPDLRFANRREDLLIRRP